MTRARRGDAQRRANAALLPAETPRAISGVSILLVWIGLYLFLGGVVSLLTDAWPFFMPPEVGFIQSVLAVFGARESGYIEGSALGLTGLACCYFGAAALLRKRKRHEHYR
ncbi:MAG: hypothetical protein ACXWHB_02540 [Usitatibacter sp.]